MFQALCRLCNPCPIFPKSFHDEIGFKGADEGLPPSAPGVVYFNFGKCFATLMALTYGMSSLVRMLIRRSMINFFGQGTSLPISINASHNFSPFSTRATCFYDSWKVCLSLVAFNIASEAFTSPVSSSTSQFSGCFSTWVSGFHLFSGSMPG